MPGPQPTAPRPVVRWIGPAEGPEFGPCADVVRRDATLHTDNDSPADLTVLACPRPLADVAPAGDLVAAVGSDRFVQLLGVWCEGEGRTGKAVTDARRVFWHAWPSWWRQWLAEQSTTQGRRAAEVSCGLVRIDTTDAELARAIVTALDAEGIAAVWSRRSLATRPAAIVWDGAQLNGFEADRVARIAAEARHHNAAVVALLDFPRPKTVAALRDLGATAVLGKPFDRDLLLETLRYAVDVSKRRTRCDRLPLPGVDLGWCETDRELAA